ncbi:MAG: hypothetical protein ACF8Q5_01545 [Phycisphaerales bacterium JB040]
MSPSSRKPLTALAASLLAFAAALAGATQQDAPRPFDPFTDHERLPPDLTWVVQLEHPARQFDSSQTRILEDAIADTELFAASMKAWDRLTDRLAPGDSGAGDILGRRAQFIARDALPAPGEGNAPSQPSLQSEAASQQSLTTDGKNVGGGWAVAVELSPELRKPLLARLRALPRDLRHKRYVYELEDGRFILAEFEQPGAALVILAPRSDRTLPPERDPASALFFELFDRLAGHPPPETGPCPLAPSLKELSPAEILVAHRAHADARPPRITAVALDRAPGGWSGRLVLSTTRDGPSPAPAFEPASLDRALPDDAALARLLLQNAALPLVTAASPLPGTTPAAPDTPTLVAVLKSTAHDGERPRVRLDYLQLSIVDAQRGPPSFDASLAALPAPNGAPLPDHAGLFPTAVRRQTARLHGPLAQDFGLLWGFSEPMGDHRVAALLIAAPAKDSDRARLESLRRILATVALTTDPPETAPVSSGHVRPGELASHTDALIPESSPLHALPGVIKSVSWSLAPAELDGRRVLRGPVELLVVPTPQAQLGNP